MNNSKRSYLIALGTFLVVACSAFAVSLIFYLSGLPLIICDVLLVLFAALGVFMLLKASKMPKAPPLSRRDSTIRLTVTAVMLGCVAVTKLFRFEIPMFGGSGMTVGFSGIFTSIPAMLYGPLYGAVASAGSDILGCIISPIGAYNPLFTLTAFVGGFIKGSVWLMLKDKKSSPLRWVSTVLAVLLLTVGITFAVSLKSDGIYGGGVAVASDIPSRGVIDGKEKTPFSELVTSLASYSKDSYTITSYDSASVINVPSHIEIDGVKYVTRIGKNAFADFAGDIYVPSGITKIDLSAFNANATIHIEESMSSYFEGADLKLVIEDKIEKTTVNGVYGGSSQKAGGFSWSYTPTYASAVAKYINFLTLGPILAGGSMLVVIAVSLIIMYLRKRNGKEAFGISGVRIFISVFSAGFVSTTINTVILRYITYPSWVGRAFYIVWIPRVAEELIVCLIQSYFIAVLYDLYQTRFAKRH